LRGLAVSFVPTAIVEPTGRPPRHRRRGLQVAALAAVVALAGAVGYVERTNPYGVSFSRALGLHDDTASGTQDNSAATSTATVEQRSLSQTTSVSGTLGYAGSYTVLAQAHGTITWLPAVGLVIQEGQVLYRVDGRPVVLLYGSTPAYRALAAGAHATDVTGSDVAELNHDLVAMGYIGSSQLDPSSDEFTWATELGLERLQDALGVTENGALALGDAVFLPTAARITAVSATPGGPAGGPVLTATSTTRQVTVELDAAAQSEIEVGDQVAITLPNNQSTPGRVTSVGTVATAPSGSGPGANSFPTVTVNIEPTDPAATGSLDQAPVQVAITTNTAQHVLAVPVNALLALSGDRYAVEVVGAGGAHHLVPVSLGLFDDADGLVQVSGSGLAPGQRVVVPAQ
jgi:hypothetical protein